MVGWVTLDPNARIGKACRASDLNHAETAARRRITYEYPWFSFEGVTGSASCGLCHREYKEWQADAHSQAAKNVRFLDHLPGNERQGAAKASEPSMATTAPPCRRTHPNPIMGPVISWMIRTATGTAPPAIRRWRRKSRTRRTAAGRAAIPDLTSERAATGVMDPGVSPR